MSISGVLIHADPSRLGAVKEGLEALNGVEIHHETEDGRLIVTIEERGGDGGETLMRMHNVAGVLSASLVYQNFEILNEEPDVAPEEAAARPAEMPPVNLQEKTHESDTA